MENKWLTDEEIAKKLGILMNRLEEIAKRTSAEATWSPEMKRGVLDTCHEIVGRMRRTGVAEKRE